MSEPRRCDGQCHGHDVGDGVTSGGRTWCMTDPYRPVTAAEPDPAAAVERVESLAEELGAKRTLPVLAAVVADRIRRALAGEP